MPSELALLDSDILVRAFQGASEYHLSSLALLEQARKPDAALCVVPQTVVEFVAVITDPCRVTAAQPAVAALQAAEAVLALPGISVLPPPRDLMSRWFDLMRLQPRTGGHVFDLHLIATMLGNGVHRVYTFDSAQFDMFPEVEVLIPPSVGFESAAIGPR
jgi:predicted nucleic acid-binding protein